MDIDPHVALGHTGPLHQRPGDEMPSGLLDSRIVLAAMEAESA